MSAACSPPRLPPPAPSPGPPGCSSSWAVVLLAVAIQELYERAFELDRRGIRDMLRGLIWLAVLVGCSVLVGLGWARAAQRGRPGLARGHRPGGIHRLLVVHDLVPAGGTDLLAGPVPGRRRHGRVLGGHEAVFSVVFSGIVTSDDEKYGPIGVVFAAHVLADRHRGRDHLGRGGRHRVAGAEPVVQGCPQETAAAPERGANHEILTERQATRVAALTPAQSRQVYPAWVMPGRHPKPRMGVGATRTEGQVT